MANLTLIVKTIDKFLDTHNLTEITAVDANAILAKEGVLNDSSSRPGLPLRKLLRANKIPTAEYRIKPGNQLGNWFIHHS